uniref:NnrU domain-containing protein n=1 Tax=Auxenochlorella protothecoides TaxID=3075 RepID=A0A1D2ADV2_AUXPR
MQAVSCFQRLVPCPCRTVFQPIHTKSLRKPQVGLVRRAVPPTKREVDASETATKDGRPDEAMMPALQGEDAAAFSLEDQSLSSWVKFSVLLAGVFALLYPIWISPDTGLGKELAALLSSVGSSSEVTMVLILTLFGVVHSGLAALRPQGEALIGARAFRVVFASLSLPLAGLAVMYFINHRYDGVALWNIRGLPGVHSTVWALSFLSFYFLYPSTFNLLEVAAVDEPRLHLWETGVARITRHPQAFGQFVWCAAHAAWVGSSFMMVTTAALLGYHAFGCWHGDRRLEREHGEAFRALRDRTSVVPFQAVWEGRQRLPPDYWREWARLPYLAITLFCFGTYAAHPAMQQAAYWLGW